MRIAVVGAGAMGSAFAAYLARAGCDVVLVGRGRPHVEAIAARGLRVDAPDGTAFVVQLEATADAVRIPAGSVDVLVVLTKAFDTAAAAAGMGHAPAPGGWVVTLQNGLGNDRVLARAFGAERVLAGVTTVGAQRHELGRIRVSASTAAGASLTHVGPSRTTGAPLAGASAIADALSGAGLPTVATADVAAAVWGKLALAVMGPVSAVLRRSVADVWRHPDGRALVGAMFDEVVAVAAAEGVRLARDEAWAHAVRTYEGTGDHVTSMCADVVHSRPTEIEAMAGEVARRGAALGVAVPVHETVARLVRTLEATYARAR